MAERTANGSAANRIRNIVAPLRANILLVARVAGHSDPAVTLRVYAHLFRDGLSEAAEKYDPLGVAAAR